MDLYIILFPELLIDPGDGTGNGIYNSLLVHRTHGRVFLQSCHQVTDVEIGNVVHTVRAQGGPVEIWVQGIVLTYVDAFNMVHGMTMPFLSGLQDQRNSCLAAYLIITHRTYIRKQMF